MRLQQNVLRFHHLVAKLDEVACFTGDAQRHFVTFCMHNPLSKSVINSWWFEDKGTFWILHGVFLKWACVFFLPESCLILPDCSLLCISGVWTVCIMGGWQVTSLQLFFLLFSWQIAYAYFLLYHVDKYGVWWEGNKNNWGWLTHNPSLSECCV
jgi:hypothetical protein